MMTGGPMQLNVRINGVAHSLEISPGAVLGDVLRRLGYTGTKMGCREGHCGSCMVLVNGKPFNSCLLLAAKVEGAEVTTIEGLGDVRNPHPVQEAFVEAGAVQCGFCTPGMVLVTKALLEETNHPSEERVREALSGNLCRCPGYVKIFEAVKLAELKLAKRSTNGKAQPGRPSKKSR
ncbi:MAG: (2Fe-2S)-binding protein [Candidatus Sumerlaeaceae bacterium]|nr:(2Fe-2S)-binding protein [Candidatus Sumerlaeaceae bacterium]